MKTMTDAELMAFNKEVLAKGRDLDYELGRETARRYIAEGIADNFSPDLIASVFGKAYGNGYADYLNAYRVLYR